MSNLEVLLGLKTIELQGMNDSNRVNVNLFLFQGVKDKLDK